MKRITSLLPAICMLVLTANGCAPSPGLPATATQTATAEVQSTPEPASPPSPSPTSGEATIPTVQPGTLFSQRVDSLLADKPAHWNILIKDIQEDSVLYSRLAEERVHPGSIIKVAIAALFFKALEQQGISNYADYIAHHGADGRTFQQLLRAMLVFSEEQATQSLATWITQEINIRRELDNWGMPRTQIEPRRSTAGELAFLFESIYDGSLLGDEARDIMLALMSEYTPPDDTRLGVLKHQLPELNLYNKRSTITAETLLVGDAAILQSRESAMVIILLGSPQDSSDAAPDYDQLVSTIEAIAAALAGYLLTP